MFNFYQFVLTKHKNLYSLQNLQYLGQMHRYIDTKMQQACRENKLTLEKTKL